MAGRSEASHWRRVNRNNPCPICKHAEWCSVSADGALAKCMRVEEGAFKTGEQKDGARYYLHRLAGEARRDPTPPPRPPGPGAERADADLLHRAYSALLARLHLLPTHREALKR